MASGPDDLTLGGDAWRLPSTAWDLEATDDDRHVIVLSEHGDRSVVTVVDVRTGRELADRRFVVPRACRVVASRDGGVLAVAAYEGGISAWDLRTGSMLRELDRAEDAGVVPYLALDARGARLLVWNTARDPDRRGVFVFDVATGERLLRAPVPGQSALSLDSATLVGGLENPHRVRSWDLASAPPRELHTVETRGWAWQYAPLAGGDMVFATSEGEVRRWSPREGVTRWVRQLGVNAHHLRASHDGRRVGVMAGYGAPAGTHHLFDGLTGATAWSGPHAGRHALAFAADGSWRATIEAGRLAVTSLPDGERLDRVDGHVGAVQALTFSADGRLVVSAADDGIRVWGLDDGGVRWTLEPPSAVDSLVVTPDGRRLVALCGGSEVVAWDLATGAERSHVTTLGPCTALSVSPDARYVLWASPALEAWSDGPRATTLWAWDLSRRDAVALVGHAYARGEALHVGVTRDARRAVVFTGERPWIVDLSRLRRMARGRVPGRGRLVGADLDGDIAVGLWSLDDEATAFEWNTWQPETGTTLDRPRRVGAAALLPSCHGGPVAILLWRAEARQAFELIDGRTREEIVAVDLRPMNDLATRVVVSPDGRRVAVGTDRGRVLVCRVATPVPRVR